MQPIVSVIVPTTHDRKEFNDRILKQFILQDYQNKFITFDYNEGCVGEKRNRLCEAAKGEIIVHFDSDDHYAPDWISKSVKVLLDNEADITGLQDFNLWHTEKQEALIYNFGDSGFPFITGATFCYRKEYWKKMPFEHMQTGEDYLFLLGAGSVKPKVFIQDYIDGFLATIHRGNTSFKVVDNIRYKWCDEERSGQIRKRFLEQKVYL